MATQPMGDAELARLRAALRDAAVDVSECEDIPAAMALLRRAAGGER